MIKSVPAKSQNKIMQTESSQGQNNVDREAEEGGNSKR